MSSPAVPPLPLRDTPDRYGRVTRFLHWGMAALLLWQFIGMVLREILGRTPLVSFFTGSHQMVGTVLFLLTVMRLIWAFANRGNRPAHGEGVLGLGARMGHLALYVVMFTVPAAAILRSYGSERAFSPFGFEIFAARETPITWMVAVGDALHGELGWLMLALIAGHIVMVGLHKAMWRDGTLERMAGRRRG
ncbi:cytochrome b [Paracoccus aestuariivivens]|uniref:Cytochrome b n=1 Tax=Paracoccus aestuariivivens TaxID=1820333 RepID=A0A6L6J9R7_9RHOB|nr:cytochrome b [Paracoccus aestuariivivens]MTH76731.1 cytochrome b [Paracoccus aestuariivivens]